MPHVVRHVTTIQVAAQGLRIVLLALIIIANQSLHAERGEGGWTGRERDGRKREGGREGGREGEGGGGGREREGGGGGGREGGR